MARSPATLSDLSVLQGFSAFSSTTRIFWNSRKRKGNVEEEEEGKAPQGIDGELEETKAAAATTDSLVSQRRKALFEPLPNLKTSNGPRPESLLLLLPPPDFDEAVVYPKGWLVGKKRKLVNVDVVESMRRIAIQEMNRKDREISGLNEQLEEDSRCLEHLQQQLRDERSKRAVVEREKELLQNQVEMLINLLHQPEQEEEEEEEESMEDEEENVQQIIPS